MRGYSITLALLISAAVFQSCTGAKKASDIEDEDLITHCDCSLLYLDEPYNHFYLTDRTKPYTGTCEVLGSNGTVIVLKNFKQGKLDGNYLEYFESGAIMHEWNFLENRQHGDQKIYDEKGKLLSHSVYYKGELDTIILTNKAQLQP